MRLQPEQVARVCHEANRALQAITNDPAPSPPWDEAPAWQRESAIQGVREARGGATPKALHASWVKTKERDGWKRGPVKDADARTHPCLVPYEELPPEQKAKDALFAAVVGALAPSAPPR